VQEELARISHDAADLMDLLNQCVSSEKKKLRDLPTASGMTN